MSERQDSLWISDIKEAVARVEEYTRGISYQEFLEDKKTQDAVVRNVGIMGEAAKRVSTDFKRKHKEVDWKAIAGTRDKLGVLDGRALKRLSCAKRREWSL